MLWQRKFKFLFLIVFTFLGIFCIRQMHSFLALDKPIPAKILVIEGWLPDYALGQCLEHFKHDEYLQIITTGGPLERGSYLTEYKTFAELAYASIIKMGFPKEKILALPSPPVIKDRTATSAKILATWVKNSKESFQGMNLCTLGTHARRSRFLFQKALGSLPIGVIAIPPGDYSPNAWWHSSEGVRTTLGEALTYIYARVFSLFS